MEQKNSNQCRFWTMDVWQHTPDLKLITAAFILYLYWHSHDLTKDVNKLLHTLENYRINTHTHTHTFSLPAANSLWSSDCLPNWDRFLCAVALASDQNNTFCNMVKNVNICTRTPAASWEPWSICHIHVSNCIQARKKSIYHIYAWKHNTA